MITIYGVTPSPFVRKVLVMLDTARIKYHLELVSPRTRPEDINATFKKISPLGKIPAFQDDKVSLADSSVICAYIEKEYKTHFYPKDSSDYARALWFEEYADTVLFNAIAPAFFNRIIKPIFYNQPCDEDIVKNALALLPPYCDYLESQLNPNKNTIVGNDFSIADIAITSMFVNYEYMDLTIDANRWPKLAKYIAVNTAQPAFKALIEADKKLFKK